MRICYYVYYNYTFYTKFKQHFNTFFFRLTPPYMLVLMVYVSLFHYTGSGPNWPKDGPEKNHCEKAWYYNLLYINNFVDDKENQVHIK